MARLRPFSDIVRPVKSLFRLLSGSSARKGYAEWIERNALSFLAKSPGPKPAVRFSILTSAYNTPPDLLDAAAESVFGQTYGNFEWILLDNGSDLIGTIGTARAYSSDPRVKYARLEKNIGVIGGMRECLKRAEGDYAVPLDSDDLLNDRALEVLALAAGRDGAAAFIYSDEDILAPDGQIIPYCRPDWDPVLNLCTSYIFHLCAFDRRIGQELGLYSDDQSNYCHDWDSVFRFWKASHEPFHIPLVLYRWRSHESSSTNRPAPDRGSLSSQEHVLRQHIAGQPDPDLFSIETFPISRGAPELWIRRKRQAPEPVQAAIVSKSMESAASCLERLARSAYPFSRIDMIGLSDAAQRDCADSIRQRIRDRDGAGIPAPVEPALWRNPGLGGLQEASRAMEDRLTLVISDDLTMDGDEWPWEAMLLRSLHPDSVLIASRILSPDRRVLAGNEIFGFNGLLGCPDRGLKDTDPGYFALALKRHSTDAVHPACFLADGAFLKDCLAGLPDCATYPFLGAWLGALAAHSGSRVVFSPMITSIAGSEPLFQHASSDAERALYKSKYGPILAERRWYSPLFGNTTDSAYLTQ